MYNLKDWFKEQECRLFRLLNIEFHHPSFQWLLGKLTHLGGATATIAITLLVAIFSSDPIRIYAIEAAVALTISHLPVAFFKKRYARERPYLSIPGVMTVDSPLEDHSFPSGHTTAIFSVTMPYMIHMPMSCFILLPLASLIGFSRIYLGLHYPSDVLVGALLGISSVFLVDFAISMM